MNILSNAVIGKKWSLTARDWVQGAVMAAIGAVGGQLYSIAADWVAADTFNGIDKHSLMLAAKGAIFAAAVYLAKRFIQKPDIIIPNPPSEVVSGVKDNSKTIAAISTTTPINQSK